MLEIVLALLADVLAVGLIPWLVAGLKKKSMTPKGYKWLSIAFAILGPGKAFGSVDLLLHNVLHRHGHPQASWEARGLCKGGADR